MEEKLKHSLYKIEIHLIKVIPILISILIFAGTLLSYLDVDTTTISYITALLVWLFLYLSSFVFKFCRWHRVFLYYILVESIINWYDYTYIIPLSLRPMIAVQIGLACIFICLGLYCHIHDRKCNKKHSRQTTN